MSGRIRNLAVGLLVRDGHVLVERYPGSASEQAFDRAVGGGIEFGERAADAIVREYREELGAEVEVVGLLAVTENLFEWEGQPAHEVVHVFGISCSELCGLPLDARLPILDQTTSAYWRPLDGSDVPFYPDGIGELARSL